MAKVNTTPDAPAISQHVNGNFDESDDEFTCFFPLYSWVLIEEDEEDTVSNGSCSI
ncbi:hypothetical protein Hanom_Chr03g00261321 [Helianthus anomalus]